MSDLPQYPHGSPHAPGTDTVIEAGHKYTLKGSDGSEFGIDVREHHATMEFLSAFDQWLAVQGMQIEQQIKDELWHSMTKKFHSLPRSITDKLPSRRSGVTVVQR